MIVDVRLRRYEFEKVKRDPMGEGRGRNGFITKIEIDRAAKRRKKRNN